MACPIVRDAVLLTAVAIATFVIACLGTRALIPLLTRAAVLDRPNERSSHTAPTPRGGGIAVVAAILLAWVALVLVLTGRVSVSFGLVLCGALLLALVSWVDDRRSLSPAVRLSAQFVAVALPLGALMLMGVAALPQIWLPHWLGAIAAAVLWLWFTNLFNFMDGIDGLAASEAAAIGTGLTVFACLGSGDPEFAALPVAIAGAASGFLVWNWAPARIFLGDVGSVPLGYLLGFLLLGFAGEGHWKIAVILPLYFVADATITLLRRFARGEQVWQAHREHFYQRAVQRGLSHAAVVCRVIAANLLLIALGWAAENGGGIAAVAAAAVVVAVLLLSLAGLPGGGRRPIPAPKPGIEEPPA